MKFAVQLLLIGLSWKQLRATTVVVIRNPNHIVVAADTRITRNNNQLPPAKRCKIMRVRGDERLVERSVDVYYTSSGFSLDLQQKLARDDIRRATSIAQAADMFSRQSKVLVQELQRWPQDEIEKLADRPRLEAVFFGIEDGIPKVVEVTFVQIGSNRKNLDLRPLVMACPQDESPAHEACPPELAQSRSFATLGIDDHIRRTLSHDISLEGKADEAIVRSLVKMEAQRHRDSVSQPIDLLTLDATGAHWANGGTCAASASPERTKPISRSERAGSRSR